MENGNEFISVGMLTIIITATVIGTLTRILSIKLDHRQYPNYPNGYLIHTVTGGLAAAIGGFIIPALVAKEFTAVTFLALGIQHFRDVRKVERESLLDLEGEEYVRRGDAYIDGIAKLFESRNYITLLVAFFTALTIQLVQIFLDVGIWVQVGAGSAVGLMVFYILKSFTNRQLIRDIATVTVGKIEIKGSDLYVDGMFVSHLAGREEAKKWFLEDGLAAIVEATHEHYQVPLHNKGQRRAMLFEVSRRLGQRRIYGVQELYKEKLIIAVVPIIKDADLLKETILLTPLLETVKKNPKLLNTKEGG